MPAVKLSNENVFSDTKVIKFVPECIEFQDERRDKNGLLVWFTSFERSVAESVHIS